MLRFIEDNWLDGARLPGGSFDSIANPIDQMFDFDHFRWDDGTLVLDPTTGLEVKHHGW